MWLDKLKVAIKSRPCLYLSLRPFVVFFLWPRRKLLQSRLDRFRKCLLELPQKLPGVVFVKVGANDGISGDPCSDLLVKNTGWRGVLIEPVPYCWERLRENYSDESRFVIERVAVGEKSGRAPFYYVAQEAKQIRPNLPEWYVKIGSFNKDHLIRHIQGIEPYLIVANVEVCTLQEIMDRNGIQTLHLLHVDAEGSDLVVLKQLNFSPSPILIFIEHQHLKRSEKHAMRRLLRKHGFRIWNCGTDYFAYNGPEYVRQCNAAKKRFAVGT